MPYDAELADRVRDELHATPGLPRGVVSEQRMFGGLAFLVEDYLAVAVSHQGGLLLRVDPAEEERLRTQPHVVDAVMRDRPMHGWLRVDAAGCVDGETLRGWVRCGVERALQLPARQADPLTGAGA